MPRLVEEVDAARRVLEMLKQLLARHAGLAAQPTFLQPIHERAVGQLHRKDEPAGNVPDAVNAEQVTVPDAFQKLQGAQLTLRAGLVGGEELDRNGEAAGADGAPDLAEAAL